MYKRKTVDEWQVHGFYCNGWEEVTCADNRKEAKQLLNDYRKNEPMYSFKLVKRRIKFSDSQ